RPLRSVARHAKQRRTREDRATSVGVTDKTARSSGGFAHWSSGAGATPEIAGREEENRGPKNKRRPIADQNDQDCGKAANGVRETGAGGAAQLRGNGFDGSFMFFAKREMDVGKHDTVIEAVALQLHLQNVVVKSGDPSIEGGWVKNLAFAILEKELEFALLILRVLQAGFDIAALLNDFVGGFLILFHVADGFEVRKRG